MNLENIKKHGARQALVQEAIDIRFSLSTLEEQYKWYEAEQKAKDLQAIYAELLAESKSKS